MKSRLETDRNDVEMYFYFSAMIPLPLSIDKVRFLWGESDISKRRCKGKAKARKRSPRARVSLQPAGLVSALE